MIISISRKFRRLQEQKLINVFSFWLENNTYNDILFVTKSNEIQTRYIHITLNKLFTKSTYAFEHGIIVHVRDGIFHLKTNGTHFEINAHHT